MKKLIIVITILILTTGFVFTQDAFGETTENPPEYIGILDVKMSYWVKLGRDEVTGFMIPDSLVFISKGIGFEIARMDSNDNEVGKRLRGDLFPHITNNEKTGLENFMDSIYGKGTDELIP